MKIYLNPEVASGLGEDTFWMWFKREFPNSEFLSPNSNLKYNDVILQYSTMGRPKYPKNTICLLWELYPEMKKVLGDDTWDSKIAKINESVNFSYRAVVASELAIKYYRDSGKKIDVLPIGVDTDLFRPLENKNELRKKYDIPQKKKVGVWVGTTHKMKGFDKLTGYMNKHPDIFWILIWKWEQESLDIRKNNCRNFVKIPQMEMNELFNCADFFLSTSRLHPFYMAEWEALAANLPFIIIDNVKKDFLPGKDPRKQVFRYGWDRKSTKKIWLKYINKFSQEKDFFDWFVFMIKKWFWNLKFLINGFTFSDFKKVIKLKLKNILVKVSPTYRKINNLETDLNEKYKNILSKLEELSVKNIK